MTRLAVLLCGRLAPAPLSPSPRSSGASEQDLANILRTYNQPTDPSHIYDSVYTCFKQNSVGWVSWCGGPYTCEPITGWPQARCK
ncbi:predicted protein [Chaetomium globosum CBS 148.51]|uniref:Uncharacterized protein n=1 Tax=Chaetomium globosum (strain ATCC 6205 / CBS 148.51 / DSM 1962 / NBRC 6347 / NRRL 1970) TaxID=306901 RepID=Q2H837_CHAGB|nr:uncharacterized protein CHGG_03617 [Chaetomium globosum CBS 148.51]EAQ91682.1 predicted protein [Chaetomium globosum CBS 148.51]